MYFWASRGRLLPAVPPRDYAKYVKECGCTVIRVQSKIRLVVTVHCQRTWHVATADKSSKDWDICISLWLYIETLKVLSHFHCCALSSSWETICSEQFADRIRTAVHYIVSKNQKLTIKSSVKKMCFPPALETVQSRCIYEFVWH